MTAVIYWSSGHFSIFYSEVNIFKDCSLCWKTISGFQTAHRAAEESAHLWTNLISRGIPDIRCQDTQEHQHATITFSALVCPHSPVISCYGSQLADAEDKIHSVESTKDLI